MSELRGTAALATITVVSGAALALLLPAQAQLHPAAPRKSTDGEYLGSGACRSCHPGEHASFHRTFHSTMTRKAAELSWDGKNSPHLPAHHELYGRNFELRRDASTGVIRYFGPDLHRVGGEISRISRAPDASAQFKEQKSQEAFRAAPQVERELVLVTGSHHYLAFWIEGGEGADLRQFPFVYLLDEERFLPRSDAFLQPPDALPHIARWNSNCIQCHTVGGRPQQSEGRDPVTGEFWEKYETEVAEEGISCEACHGPGREHATYYRNPLERAFARREKSAKSAKTRSGNTAAHIFVPRAEEGENASEACGQCHSYFVPNDPQTWWESGFTENFRAGDSLEASRTILRAPAPGADEPQGAALIDHDLRTIFWEDGSIIVGGREYNGLTESPCYERGHGDTKLACTSCHSMHKGDPNRQIDPEKKGDAMCTACHSTIGADHSRHKPDSPGARCVNCHMPRTSYALLHGIPSHKISSPSMKMERPPNACSLCHVDRTRAWIAEKLAQFGLAPEAIPDSNIPLAVELALAGNAAERALYAYALGTNEARATASSSIAAALLPRLEKDPYAAVRLIAARARAAVDTAQGRNAKGAHAHSDTLPPLSEEILTQLEAARDNTPIIVSE